MISVSIKNLSHETLGAHCEFDSNNILGINLILKNAYNSSQC